MSMLAAYGNMYYGYSGQKGYAKDAYEQQLLALARARREYKKMYEPYSEFGTKAIGSLQNLIDDPSSIRELPGYQFGLDEATRAVESSAASRGMLLSGRTLAELGDRSQGYQDQFYGNEYARRMGAAQMGYGIDRDYYGTLADLWMGVGQAGTDYNRNLAENLRSQEEFGRHIFSQQLGTWTGMLSGSGGGGSAPPPSSAPQSTGATGTQSSGGTPSYFNSASQIPTYTGTWNNYTTSYR
jgi:hypothetical protein